MVERITEAGWSVAQAAQAAGISVRQSYRWLARYRAEGAAGLGIAARRRTAVGTGLLAIGLNEIERLRRQRMSGPPIARQLGMPVSTVGGVADLETPTNLKLIGFSDFAQYNAIMRAFGLCAPQQVD